MSSNKLLICASGQLDNIGGIQRSYQILTKHLLKKGWKITLWGFAKSLDRFPSSSDLAAPLDEEISIEILPERLNSKSVFTEVKNKMMKVDPDLVLVINSSPKSLFFLQLAKSLNIPSVYSMRGATEYCIKYLWPCKAVFDTAFAVADAAHLLMPSYTELLKESHRQKVTVIPSQIESAKFFASPDRSIDRRYKLIYSGRLSFEKQIHYLIYAFARISDQFKDWDLLIAGDGPLKKDLEDLASRLNISDRIIWKSVKNTEEMYKLYPQCHLKVLPSEYEGCPMALREAMAHGIPVVAYDSCTGANEIITSEYDGILVGSDKPIENLAAGIKLLMSEPRTRKLLGLNGIKTAKKFEPDRINEQWHELLIKTVSGNYRETEKHNLEFSYINLLEKITQNFSYASYLVFYKGCSQDSVDYKNFLSVYGHRLFDDKFYLENYLEVKLTGEDPLLHYIKEGWKKGFNPSAEFDNNHYVKTYMNNEFCNSDGKCPLVHFYEKGRYEGCFPKEVDTDYFIRWPKRKPASEYSILDDQSKYASY